MSGSEDEEGPFSPEIPMQDVVRLYLVGSDISNNVNDLGLQ